VYKDDVRALNSRKSPTAKKISLRDDSRFASAVVAVAVAVSLTVGGISGGQRNG
jgi:hypothetical protein